MRIALLVGANPRTCTDSARVHLARGHWQIQASGLEDSKILLTMNSESEPSRFSITKETNPIEVVSLPNIARVTFAEKGSENFITVIATRLSIDV